MDSGSTIQVKMKIVILILAVLPAALSTKACNKGYCGDYSLTHHLCEACIYGVCHNRQELTAGNSHVILEKVLAVDYGQKLIYCNFRDEDKEIEHEFVGHFDSADNFKNIVHLGYTGKVMSTTVDQKTHLVYVATVRGASVIEPFPTTEHVVTAKPMKLPEKLKRVKELQYQDKMYLSLTNMNGIYTYENQTLDMIIAFFMTPVKEFIVDKDHALYFTSINGWLYTTSQKGTDIIKRTFYTIKDYELSVDRNGTAYLNTHRRLYKFIKMQLFEIGFFLKFEERFRPVFDWDNNILFVEDGKLYVLKPENSRRCTYFQDTIELL